MASILVVDDRPINREFLVTLLGFVGHETLQAADGAEALALVIERHPDLVITDVLMPVMDGMEFVRRLHADPAIADTPVIFYTATYRLADARPMAQSCGVDTVIGKPASPQVILDAVTAKLAERATPVPAGSKEAAGLVRDSAAPVRVAGLPHLQQRLNDLKNEETPLIATGPASLEAATRLGLRLAALLDLGLELGLERDIDRLLATFVSAAHDIMNAQFSAASLADRTGDVSSLALHGLPDELSSQLATASLTGTFSTLLANGQLQRLAGAAAIAVLPLAHPPVCDLLLLPIRSLNRHFGWLYFADKQGATAFADEDVQIATVLATKLSRACENLRLYEEAQSHARELEIEVAARRENESRFRLAVDAVGIGIWSWNLKTNQVTWDQHMFELFGLPTTFPTSEITYDYWRSHVHPDDLGFVEAQLRRLIAGQGRYDPSFRIIRDDGEVRWLKVASIVEYDSVGKPVQVVGTNLDITAETLAKNQIVELNANLETQVAARTADLEAAMQSLNDQKQFIRTVTDSVPVLIGYWDADLRLGFANAAYREWLDNPAPEILGLPMQALIEERLFNYLEPHIRAVLRGEEQTFERTVAKRDGSTGHMLANYLPDRMDDQIRGFYVMVTDVTQLKEAELRLADLNVELERRATIAESATHAKGEFLANMSHEIRTPMNGILGLCYLMEKQNLPSASREMLRRINAAGRSLLGIINDILDFSKIEARQLDIERVPFRLSDVLDNLATLMSAAVGSKPVELVVGPAPTSADFLTGDPLRLGQVLINLGGNAIKFTERGEVVVRVERLDDVAGTGQATLRFSVRDTGIGIAPEKQGLIFHAFSQADTSTTRSFGGTGLGLTISHRLVELMGGSLQLDSQPGQGSEFSFELAFALSDPGDSVVPEMSHQRVLIADDQDTARGVLAETVTSLGWHSQTVESGESAIAWLSNNAACDILLLDWRMPGLDGLQAAAQIRSTSSHRTDPIIVMVTAYDREQLQQESGNGVVDVILTKPVTASSLYYAVMDAKYRRGEFTLAAAPRASQQLAGVKVLLVDDSDLNRDVAASILREEGATVELAEDGSVALTALNVQPDFFDVVLMDIQMPVMDGYAATRQIRATASLAHLPVIALSAGAFNEQRDLALAAGVNEFVAKPFDVEQLVAIVGRLARPDAAGRLSEVSCVTAPKPVKAKPIASDPAAVLDLARGSYIWKDGDVYRRWLRKFVSDNAGVVAQIAAAAPDERQRLAHKLKGVAGNLGVPGVAAAADELNRRPEQLPDPSAAIARLQAAWLAAQAAIARLAPAPEVAPSAAQAITIVDPARLRPLIEQTLRAMAEANPDAVDRCMAAVAASVPQERLQPVRDSLDNFDFRVASDTLRQIANDLGIFWDK